jgi:hypothetical protein
MKVQGACPCARTRPGEGPSFECNVTGGFMADPNVHPRFGSVIEMDGFGPRIALKSDLKVGVSFNDEADPSFQLFN